MSQEDKKVSVSEFDMDEKTYIDLLDRFAMAALPLCANQNIGEFEATRSGRRFARFHENENEIRALSVACCAYEIAEKMFEMRELSIEYWRQKQKEILAETEQQSDH